MRFVESPVFTAALYYWTASEEAFYMLYMYTKSEQQDLTPAQVKVLARLVRQEFK